MFKLSSLKIIFWSELNSWDKLMRIRCLSGGESSWLENSVRNTLCLWSWHGRSRHRRDHCCCLGQSNLFDLLTFTSFVIELVILLTNFLSTLARTSRNIIKLGFWAIKALVYWLPKGINEASRWITRFDILIWYFYF